MQSGAGLALDGQQLSISPEVLRPLGDEIARQVNCAVIVDCLERPEAAVAHVNRPGGKPRLAQMALQADERAHTASATM